jgi:hypothetical protein
MTTSRCHRPSDVKSPVLFPLHRLLCVLAVIKCSQVPDSQHMCELCDIHPSQPIGHNVGSSVVRVGAGVYICISITIEQFIINHEEREGG